MIDGVSVEEKRCNDEEDDAEAADPPLGASRGEPSGEGNSAAGGGACSRFTCGSA